MHPSRRVVLLARRGSVWYAVAMTAPQNTDGSEREDRPGKTRTWWHPLLARLLDYGSRQATCPLRCCLDQ